MIIVDTNVLSEASRAAPSRRVLDWLARQAPSRLFTTAITEAEILTGLAMLPLGKRRAALEASTRRMFIEDFANRVLAFDSVAAQAYAAIVARRRKTGRSMAAFDAQIAAIAHAHGAAIATRNVDDFDNCGIEVIDPWSA